MSLHYGLLRPSRKRRGVSLLAPIACVLTGMLVAAAPAGAVPAFPVNFGDQVLGSTSTSITTVLTIDSGYEFFGSIPGSNQSALNEFNIDYSECLDAHGPTTCAVTTTFSPLALGTRTFIEAPYECPLTTGSCPSVATITFTGVGDDMPPIGTLSITPSSGPGATSIGVTSLTPCPADGTTSVPLTLHNSAGTVVASATAKLTDSSEDWAGTLTVPAEAPSGSYFVSAECSGAVDLQNYAYVSFVLGTGSGAVAGPQGPSGTNGTNGAAGPAGSPGPAGPAGPAAPRPTKSTIKCTTAKSKGTTCTATYIYAATAAMASRARAEAVAEIDGRTEVLGVGAIRDHRLGLTLRHLRAGHYRLTLVELPAGGKPIVVGHSDLKVG